MLVINAKIYTMFNDEIIKDGFILVKDKKIKKVGPMSDCTDYSEEDDVIDAGGMSLFPGFVDAFSYIGSDFLDISNKNLVLPHMRAIDSVNFKDKSFENALRSGITSVVISPMSNRAISGQIFATKTHTECFGSDDAILKSLVGIKFSLEKNGFLYFDKESSSRMSSMVSIREELLKTKKYLEDKKFAISDLERFESSSYDVKHEALIELLEKDIPAFISASSKDEILSVIRISKEFSIRVVLVNPVEIELLSEELFTENNIEVLISPLCSSEFFCKNSECNIVRIPAFLSKKTASVAISSSHPFSPVFCLRVSAALAVRAGMEFLDALKSITINAAKICGIQKRVGSIEVGKDADFVMFRNNLFDILKEPDIVVCNGNKIL